MTANCWNTLASDLESAPSKWSQAWRLKERLCISPQHKQHVIMLRAKQNTLQILNINAPKNGLFVLKEKKPKRCIVRRYQS